MNAPSAFYAWLYSIVLRLYPARFRAEFGDEMQAVFVAAAFSLWEQSTLRGVQFILRELIHLPGSLWYANEWSIKRERGHPVPDQNKRNGLDDLDIRLPDPVRKPSSLAGTLAGVGLFVFLGLIYVIQSAILSNPMSEGKQIQNILLLLTFLLPAVGFIIGWKQGFPRWWYPYAGHILIYSLVLSVQSLEGSALDRLAGRNVPGWTAWLPFLLAVAISLLLTRSRKPLRSLVSGLNDLSFLNFALLAGYTWYIFSAWVDNPGFQELPLLISAYSIMIVSAWLVLRSRRVSQRLIALAAAFLLINALMVFPEAIKGAANYWPSWWVAVTVWLILSLVALAPILLMMIVNPFRRSSPPGEAGSGLGRS